MSAAVAWGTITGPQQGPSSLRPVQLCNRQSNGDLVKLLGGKNGWEDPSEPHRAAGKPHHKRGARLGEEKGKCSHRSLSFK